MLRTAVVAGLLAGVATGLVDGTRAALLARLDGLGLVACIALVVAVDALAGAAAGALGALVAFVALWGRAAVPGVAARVVGWVIAGGVAATAAAGAVVGTAQRNNRFLAAGVVCLAMLGAAVGTALVAPALARLVARFLPARASATAAAGGGGETRWVSYAGLLVVAPLLALVLAAVVFGPVWYARAPVRAGRQTELMLLAGGMGAVLPWLLARAARVAPSVRRGPALAAAAVLFAAPALVLVWARWRADFQFVRWRDVLAGAALLALGLGAGLRLARRWPRRRPATFAAVAPAVALVLLLLAGASEPARKASGRAGLAGPVLDVARVALDFDRDGYPRLLGGGDCDDRDPDVNPGAQEWPEDGVDQNCDGKDATAAALRSPPLHPVPPSVPPDLNLVLVTIDTLRADHLGAYGYQRKTSPVMDRLAAEGTFFENGWAHAPSTRYSMPALATGRWPSAIAWDESIFWPRIAPQQRTIGETLRALGYLTGAFYAYHYFDPEYARGFERGIDVYDARLAKMHEDLGGPVQSRGSSAREMADQAIAFFQAHRARKFFLWIHFYDPHLDYQRHPEAPDFGSGAADLYDGEIWFTDHQLGRALDSLKQLGLWDRTAVIVTGDHGEGMGERGIQAHGYHLYPPQTKVPFIARVPGLAPRRVKTPVSHVDIAPTLVNLARGAHQRDFLGRSMLDLMAAGAPSPAQPAPPPVFQEVTYELGTDMAGTKRRALVTATHHLIWNWTPDNTTECYDLARDPGELHDLWGTAAGAAACPPLKESLRTMVEALAIPQGLAANLAASVSAPGAQAPAPRHPLVAELGSSVRFLGFDLPASTVARGGHAELVCHFEVLERVPAGWRPFFHLEGPGGYRNLDHIPVNGAFPVDRWRPGQRIRDRQVITFPPGSPPGAYTLFVGFFRGNERMPVEPASASDGQKRLRVATIVVQ